MSIVIGILVLFALLLIFVRPFREMVDGLKTVFFGIFTGVVGLLEAFDFSSIIPADQVGYWILGVGVIGILLRALTTGPMRLKR